MANEEVGSSLVASSFIALLMISLDTGCGLILRAVMVVVLSIESKEGTRKEECEEEMMWWWLFDQEN